MSKRMTAMVLSAMLIIAFLMPWFTPFGGKPLTPKHLLPRDSNVTGYEVHKFGHVFAVMERGQIVGTLTQQETPFPLYLIYLVPLIWAWTFVSNLLGRARQVTQLIAGGLPVAGFAAMVTLYGHVTFKYLTYGAYLSAALGLGLIISTLGPSGKGKH